MWKLHGFSKNGMNGDTKMEIQIHNFGHVLPARGSFENLIPIEKVSKKKHFS